MFTHETPVRFSDTDAMGHVNNARFLTYLEDARIAFFGELSRDRQDLLANGLIVARAEVDFVKPIFFGTHPVAVTMWVEKVGGRSFTLGYRVEHGGTLVARATTVIVAYDYAASTSRLLTEDEREVLRAWEQAN